MSEIWPATDLGIARAVEHLRAGDVIGMPTETVYGLAADAQNADAVARLYETKGRPRFNPLIVHVPSAEGAAALIQGSDAFHLLANAFWPGPLTLVLPRRDDCPISELASAGLTTLAIRVPAHPVAQSLLREFDGPLVAPSANRSGKLSSTRPMDVIEEFGGAVPVIDGGVCQAGVESTIISLAGAQPTLLRPGALEMAHIEEVLGAPLATPTGTIEAPGMLSSHYAPNALMRLNAEVAHPDEAFLGFGGTPGAQLDLSPAGNLREAAANLFSMLRTLDRTAPQIAVAPIPQTGLGIAINDRLQRAAAPRPSSV